MVLQYETFDNNLSLAKHYSVFRSISFAYCNDDSTASYLILEPQNVVYTLKVMFLSIFQHIKNMKFFPDKVTNCYLKNYTIQNMILDVTKNLLCEALLLFNIR